MIKSFVDFQLFEAVVPIRDFDFPKEVTHQEFIEWESDKDDPRRDKKFDTFNTREINDIWFNKAKSHRGGANVTISLNGDQFVIQVKKRKKIGGGRYQEVTSRFYNFYIKKLEDEYYLISSRFVMDKRIRKGYESDMKSSFMDRYWIADTFTELKSFMDRVISFSKTSAINF